MRINTRLSPHAQVQFRVPERRSLGTRLAPKFKGECESRSQQSVVWERGYVRACVYGQKMASHNNGQQASVASMISVRVINTLSVRGPACMMSIRFIG